MAIERRELSDLVIQHIGQAARVGAEIWEAAFCAYTTGLLDGSIGGHKAHESPAETVFWIWWHTYQADAKSMPGPHIPDLYLASQVAVACGDKNYRVDFEVMPEPRHRMAESWAEVGLEWKRIAVEIDGHAFHEKTKEQVSYRNQRDRALQADGWKIFHFSYSELVNNPMACVAEVAQFAFRQQDGLNARMLRKWEEQRNQ